MKRDFVRVGACAAGALLASVLIADASAADLPNALGGALSAEVPGTRPWTISDIVEVARITGIALQGQSKTVAFIVKQPSIARGADRYGLYIEKADKAGTATKLLEADYLADLEWRPGSEMWSFRGDLGEGVQLYEIDKSGHTRRLVVGSPLARVGGYDGLVFSASEQPRMTGVLAYQWAPDGSALWYSKLKLLSATERKTLDDGGVVFDDTRMWPRETTEEPAAIAVELWVLNPATGSERIVATVPGDRPTAQSAFNQARWTDSHHIDYVLITAGKNGERAFSRWTADADTGQSKQAPERTVAEFSSLSIAGGNLAIRPNGTVQRLVLQARDGSTKSDFGPVNYTRIEESWRDDKSGRSILGVHYSDRDGIAAFPPVFGGDPLTKITDELSNCSFSSDLSLGVCDRESLIRAPELVAVAPATGEMTVLARPNSRYDEIKPLHTVYTHWTNRFGSVNDGYVTYPRDYESGRKYPALVITHARDAQNRFAFNGFQWDYPIQVFAERGYFVLSVNEAPPSDPASMYAYATGATNVAVSRMQYEMGYNAIASMEAAAQSLIDQGLVDPNRIGIAGYSRGAIVTTFTLSHSKLFRAGAGGDANWFSAGGYWSDAFTRAIYNGLFGGSPLDPKAFENYLAFSPSARAAQFSGPLLQQFAGASADGAIELDDALKDAKIPAELVFYRDETHVFYQPRHRAWAMELGLNWFDYWLVGYRDSDPSKAEQYNRWDAMAERWRESKLSPN